MSSINPNVPSKYVVLESTASMPFSVRAIYKHVAVLEVDADYDKPPSMISLNARGVRAITHRWVAYPANGKSLKSGIMRARKGATILAEVLNTKLPIQVQDLNTLTNAWLVTCAVVERSIPETADALVLWDALKAVDVI